MLKPFLLIFSLVFILDVHAETFEHSYGAFDRSSGGITNFERQAIYASRNATRTSATLNVCRKEDGDSVAVEMRGRWVGLSENKFHYVGIYECRPTSKVLPRLRLEAIFNNQVQCAWKGEAYSNMFAEQRCSEVYGTSAVGKTFGGCVAGPHGGTYVFETFCEPKK